MVRLIGSGSWVVLRQVLGIVPQFDSISVIVILSFNLTLPLINVICRPLHLFFSFHDHISEAYTFLFFPLVALRIVLSGIIERLIKFVVRWSRSFLFLLLVIDLRQEGGFGCAEACIDLTMDFVEVSSCIWDLVPFTSAIELRLSRSITHVSNRYIRKFVF